MPFEYAGMTVSSSHGPAENTYLKGATTASFVCGDSGNGQIEFKALVYKGSHALYIDRISAGVTTNFLTAKSLSATTLEMDVKVPVDVVAGDTVRIRTTGKYDRIYLSDALGITWKRIEVPKAIAHPTFNSCAFVMTDGSAVTSFKYRKSGDTEWIEPADFRGSVTGLEEATGYEAVIEAGGETRELSFRTWSSEVPVKETVEIPANLSGTYLIDGKGTDDGWIRYTCSGGTVTNSSSAITLYVNGASHVLIDDMKLRGAADSKVVIQVQNSDNVRIRNCDIAGWGTRDYYPDFINLNGADARVRDGSTVSCEAAIRINPGTSCAVIERCFIHDPLSRSCSWYYRHPTGPLAVYMAKPDHSTVLRFNDFIGSDRHRWNDAVEGAGNFDTDGGFNRDADVNGNFMIFANDDCIELDGGQCNVRCFDNRFEGSHCGPSVQGCMVGPSYVYNNYISGLGDEFEHFGANIKTDDDNGPDAYCLISDNYIWGGGDLPKARPAVVVGTNHMLEIDESEISADYPVRTLPFKLGRARVSVGADRSDLIVPITGDIPSGTEVVKPEAMDWFTAEISGSSLIVHFNDSRMHDRRKYRGAMLVRTPEGLSRPLSVYAESDFVPPLRPDVGSGTALYQENFKLDSGKTLTVTFDVPKAGKYWLFIHGSNFISTRQRVQLTIDGSLKGISWQQQYSYGNWSMICPELTMNDGLNYPIDLTAGEHVFTLKHTRGAYSFDGLALTDTPVAFEPR